jgi:hypothetical protein
MNKVILLVAIAVMLSACVNGKPRNKVFNSTLCGNVAGYTISYVLYGEGKMVMIPVSKVRAESVFVVKLRPLDEFEDAEVTVTGSSSDTDAQAWLTGQSGSYAGLPRAGFYPPGALEVGCVPAANKDTTYKFSVKVKKGDVTNILDPRATIVD